ncbi:MAG: FtsP/CotA-like multicopper oxidase with cupredoxin domain [Bacteriovoracaceae bacterium]
MKLLIFIFSVLLSLTGFAKSYNLTINEKMVSFSGKEKMGMAVNNSIPGPTLTFTEGDTAEINVTNNMDVETSVHWHGLILPNFQDGVPYLTTPPIRPGKTFTYRFPITHSGTYWYHSHTGLQEQQGIYGSIVIKPKKQKLKYDRDLVLVLSDWTDEDPNEVLRTLKRGSDWYSIKKKTAVSISDAISNGALGGLLGIWKMRMPGIDISDVYYDAFLINGKKDIQYSELKAGERVRVRVINAAASTYFWTTIGDANARLVSADGVDVVPVKTSKVLHAIAETYDYIVTIPKNGSIEFRASAQDGSGYATAILGSGKIHKAMIVKAPDYIERTKSSGGMNHSMDMSSDMKMDHSMPDMNMMDHSSHKMMNHNMEKEDMTMKKGMNSKGSEFSYDILKSPIKTSLKENNVKNIELNLTGNMWRYVWSLNGKTLSEVDKIKINRGEVIRVVLNNKTMMHHPMHLHGHFFRVLNKNGEYSPFKHTVDVEPMKSVTIEFPANETGDWFFHCHVLYHMKGGMARIFSYGDKRDSRLDNFSLSNVLDMDRHWYTWTETKAASHYGSIELTSSNTRNQFNLGAEYGWNKNLEADISYDRFLSDYFRVYLGANTENKIEEELGATETVGTLGVKWLLPYFIDSNFRIDSDLNLQLSFEVDYLLFSRVAIFGYWEVTNDFGWRTKLPNNSSWEKDYVWNLGLEYIATKNLSIFTSYENRFGAGAGISYIW